MMETALIILIVVAGAIAGAVVLLEVYVRWKTAARLRELFGPDYKRVRTRNAQTELAARDRIIASEYSDANTPRLRRDKKAA